MFSIGILVGKLAKCRKILLENFHNENDQDNSRKKLFKEILLSLPIPNI